MNNVEGYWDIDPKIKKVSFNIRGRMQVDFEDGRRLIVPVSAFPCLKHVPVNERNKWFLTAGGVSWDDCPEVIHVEQLLGNYTRYRHEK
jgi:hypothetical protein